MNDKILFLDIETVPQYESFEKVPDTFKKHWIRKSELLKRKDESEDDILYERAGIYSEFGKIICVSVGFVSVTNGVTSARIKSFYNHDERLLLREFSEILNSGKFTILCGHNGKEFDFPYLSRRLLINGLPLPALLDNSGKKPWEVSHKDTLEMWKFGDYKSYVSLDLLAAVFNIPTPKDDIDGSEVYRVYYKEKDLERIARYCQKDVFTLMKVYYKLCGSNLNVEDSEVIYL